MASSRGRERAQQRGPRVFVFGSSTPRDLSHMNKIPAHLRKYDARIVKESNGRPNISEYMAKARSLTRDGRSTERSWVFGSSTPRDLAHLTNLNRAQRQYDAVIPKKSSTTPNFMATPIKRSSTAAPVARQIIHKADTQRNEQIERLINDDEVSSEPDFVQDRGAFLNELKEMKENKAKEKAHEELGKSEKNLEKSREAQEEVEEHFEKPKEIGSEMTQSQVIPPNFHEEETSHTVSHQPAQPVLQDQILVAEQTEDQHKEDPVEIASQKVGELMQDGINNATAD